MKSSASGPLGCGTFEPTERSRFYTAIATPDAAVTGRRPASPARRARCAHGICRDKTGCRPPSFDDSAAPGFHLAAPPLLG
ncbi:hypothetical protein, partial [Burkholderia pseudomallei]|uniref:hypothetical protein n=1 Tax=Burkholderia pseudomallei TaxID=28450 RepID=UPI001CA5B086